MTIITSIISKKCTVHASDSLITNKAKPDEESTKIIRVPKWSGIMSFFGAAIIENGKIVRNILKEQIELHSDSYSSPEDFADRICETLNVYPVFYNEIFGIHFTAYEKQNGIPIPELFRIANWELQKSGKYTLKSNGVEYRRETYANCLTGNMRNIPREQHGEAECRHMVREYLEAGNNYIFNNGDTPLFNSSLDCIFRMFDIAAQDGKLWMKPEAIYYRKLTTLLIKQVIKWQDNFFLPDHKRVGGKVHSLSVTPDGKYESDTDD